MQTISRMIVVLPQGFLKLTTKLSALTFHAQNQIFSLSRSMRFGNALQNSCCLLNQSTFSTPFVKPLKNPSQQIRSLETVVNYSNLQSASGELHVIVGPMFAGKTTTLLRRIKTESCNGRSSALIKSNKDNRYALDSVVSHDGEKLPCWSLADLSSFREKVGSNAYDKLEVIGIDEAQFFEDLYDFCRKAADHDGKTIIVAGLDGDYLRRSFGSVLDIIPIADTVTKLTARCELCGKRAHFTLRKTEETETELIAGADVYMPVCRKHYVSGQVVKEAARTVLDSHKVQWNSAF